jgi:glycosyltransferase involved in cell wall biosynthesis
MCIEAMSMSLPVIYREGTAPHEFLASTFPFRYTSSSGINGMLKAILQTASLTKLERQRVGSQNRAIAIKSFTLKQHVMNLSSMYKDIVFKQDGP